MNLPKVGFWQFFSFSPHESTACIISHLSCPTLFTHTSHNKPSPQQSTKDTMIELSYLYIIPRLVKAKKKNLQRKKLVVMVMVLRPFCQLMLVKVLVLTCKVRVQGWKEQNLRLQGPRRRVLKLQGPHQRSLPAQRLVEENAHLKNWQHWRNKKGRSLLFSKGGNLREWSFLMFLQARIPAHHLTITAYPFVSSAMCNAFVLCPLHVIYAVIQKHMYHLTILVNMLYSLLKLSIKDFFSAVNKIVVQVQLFADAAIVQYRQGLTVQQH